MEIVKALDDEWAKIPNEESMELFMTALLGLLSDDPGKQE